MYWQYPTTGSPSWAYAINSNSQQRNNEFPGSTQLLQVPVSHGKYSLAANEYFHEIFEDDSQVKRPMNSFLLWAKIMRKKFAKDYPHLHNAEISKLLGKVWNSMTTGEKRPFVEKAEKLRVLHMRDHPNYRYAPKKKKEKRAAQRMIPPEVAAAFHNAIFDLKGVKCATNEAFRASTQDDPGEEMQDRFQYSSLQPDSNVVNPQIELFRQNLERLQEYANLTNSYGTSYRNQETINLCDIGEIKPVNPEVAAGPRKSNVRYARPCQLVSKQNTIDNVKPYRYRDGRHSHLSNVLKSSDFGHENMDQVTPSSPQEQKESLSCQFVNEENFYAPAEQGYEGARIGGGQRLQEYDSQSSSSESESQIPSSPENCYDNEVPLFLKALLEKPIHLEEPKSQPLQEKDDEIIFHDLGEIISKELGKERKACLYS